MFTVIGWMGVMVFLMFLMTKTNQFIIPQAFRFFVVLSWIPGFLLSLWFAKKLLDKQYWRLTDKDLESGIFYQKKYPLGSVEKVILGLPVDAIGKIFQKAKPNTVAGTTLDVLSAVDSRVNTARKIYQARADIDNSVLLCFKDGALLPLRLFLLPVGSTLLEQLRERLKDKLVRNYCYSDDEIRRMRHRDMNELIPPPKSFK